MANNDKLPVETLDEALPYLRRPVPAEAVHFKVQSEWDNGGLVVGYIDSRIVYERLNKVVGGRWERRIRPLHPDLRPSAKPGRDGEVKAGAKVYAVCRLTVCGVTHEEVGEGADPKAAYSDAVKRAAVLFGIGRFLYAMKSPALYQGERDNELRRSRGRKPRLIIDKRTERWLRHNYSQWLERVRGEFGEPLGHGDDPDALPDEAEADPEVHGAPEERQPGQQADQRPMPAEEHELAQLLELARGGGYKHATVRALCELLFDRPGLEALEGLEQRQLRELLGSARAGATGDDQLHRAVVAAGEQDDRERARARLRSWLVERAQGSADKAA